MMHLIFAEFLCVFALAELRVWNRSTFTGQQGTLAVGFGAWCWSPTILAKQLSSSAYSRVGYFL